MKLQINETPQRDRKTRKNRNQVQDELESQGYDIIDSGYEDYHPYEKKWINKGYDVKSWYVKSDTPGLKMWVMYGKKKG